MRRVLAFVVLSLFGFLSCTVNSKGTGANGGNGGVSGFDGGGGSSGGGNCFPGPGQKICGGQCESTTDPKYGCANPNCNPCGAVNGTATCTADGKCSVACATNFADCDKNPANGCEIDTQTNPYNCGGCVADGGKNCFLDTSASNWDCVNGKCQPSQCDFGKADCNGSGTCSIDLTSDVNNCGSCGHVCALPNASQLCQAVPNPPVGTPPGKCVIGQCKSGFEDCNHNATDGCEINIANGDPNNCGACGKKCDTTNGVPSCSNSQCTISCQSGYGNCDHDASNGCETNLTNTTNHCGQCGTACTNAHGSTSCSGSVCHPSCSGGYGDCDNNRANGCETNLQTDNSNCGVCGNACTGGRSCQSGHCLCGSGQVVYNGVCCTPESKSTACGNHCSTTVKNNCGQNVTCGGCSSGQTCDLSNYTCCTPNSCGSQCGTLPDGCGNTLSCGSCGTNQACDTNNACVCDSTYHSCGTNNSLQCFSNSDPAHCGNNTSCVDCTAKSESCNSSNGTCCLPSGAPCGATNDPCCPGYTCSGQRCR